MTTTVRRPEEIKHSRALDEVSVFAEMSAELERMDQGVVRPRSTDERAEAIRRGALALRDVLTMDARAGGTR